VSQLGSEHRPAPGLRKLWGPFLCSHRLLEGRFTTLAKHAVISEGGSHLIHIPDNRGAMAGAVDVVLTMHEEAAVGIAAPLEVVLAATQGNGCHWGA